MIDSICFIRYLVGRYNIKTEYLVIRKQGALCIFKLTTYLTHEDAN